MDRVFGRLTVIPEVLVPDFARCVRRCYVDDPTRRSVGLLFGISLAITTGLVNIGQIPMPGEVLSALIEQLAIVSELSPRLHLNGLNSVRPDHRHSPENPLS